MKKIMNTFESADWNQEGKYVYEEGTGFWYMLKLFVNEYEAVRFDDDGKVVERRKINVIDLPRFGYKAVKEV